MRFVFHCKGCGLNYVYEFAGEHYCTVCGLNPWWVDEESERFTGRKWKDGEQHVTIVIKDWDLIYPKDGIDG